MSPTFAENQVISSVLPGRASLEALFISGFGRINPHADFSSVYFVSLFKSEYSTYSVSEHGFVSPIIVCNPTWYSYTIPGVTFVSL